MATTPQETFATLAETSTTADPGSGGTSLAVSNRSKFPQSGRFRLVVQQSESDKSNREIMYVTAGHGVGSGTFTVGRGLEGTTAVAHATGSYVANALTGEAIRRQLADYTFHPRHAGLLGCTADPAFVYNTATPTTLVPFVMKVFLPENITIANAVIYVNVGASAQVAGGNQMGVFSSAGVRLGFSDPAATLTAFQTQGLKVLALTEDSVGSLGVTGGPGAFIWVSQLQTATTTAALLRSTGVSQLQLSLTAEARSGVLAAVVSGSGLPTSYTPSSGITKSFGPFWMGVN
jgi:hypothetical protein